jgi:Fe-S-cluster containining protein
MNTTQKIAALETVYATLPGIACQQKCQACCTTFGMTRLEKKRLVAAGGPFKTRSGPAFTDTETGERGVLLGVHEVIEGKCHLLSDEGLCSVYAIRPAICRIWGLSKRFKCPHGCEPERWLDDQEVYQIMRRVQELSA